MIDVSEATVKTWRRRFNLYGPAVFGAAMMGAAMARFADVVDIRLEGLLLVTGAMLAVLALHRAHEYEHGLSDWETPMWPPVAYAGAFALFLIAFRFGSLLAAGAGGLLAVGTAYARSSLRD